MSCVLILEVMHRNKLYKKITMALITLVHVPGGYSLIPVCEYPSIDRTYGLGYVLYTVPGTRYMYWYTPTPG